jgi:hypothetical protein
MLRVTAVDSVSGALVPNAVIVASGPPPDSSAFFQIPDSASIGANVSAYPVLLGTSLGTYVLTIRAAGYHTWIGSEDVADATGACHALPMAVTAVMQASP